MRKLKKWHRLGIVLSMIWVIYSVTVSRSDEMDRRQVYINMDVDICLESKRPVADCWEKAYKENSDEPYWVGHFGKALFPVIAAWIALFLSLGTYRWIMRGD